MDRQRKTESPGCRSGGRVLELGRPGHCASDPRAPTGDTAWAMSQENVEVVKEFTRLFENGDRDAWRDYLDPDVIWDSSAPS